MIVHTGMYTQTAYDVLDSVEGQWSDGMYENSRCEGRWLASRVKRADSGEVLIEADVEKWDVYYCRRYYNNPFHGASPDGVKEYFAKYVKTIAKAEIRDCGNGKWSRTDKTRTDYLGRNYGDHPIVTIGDAYLVYETLLGRILKASYDPETVAKVVGEPRSDDETRAVEAARLAAEERDRAMAAEIQAVREIANGKIKDATAKAEAEYKAAREAILAKYKDMADRAKTAPGA